MAYLGRFLGSCCFLFLLHVHVHSFLLDTNNFTVYQGPTDSLFGYSVALLNNSQGICTLSTYYSSEEDEDEEDEDESAYSEYEYADPYEEEGPYSSTPPPDCDAGRAHMVCVPPAWGELITGPAVVCRCILCHEDGRHHAIRCRQCRNAPGCCACIWGYMRSRYNSGCPLCRAGDPKGDDPLRSEINRRLPPRRRGGGTLIGVGLVRGRGRRRSQLNPEREEEEQPQRRPKRARRGRRGRGRGRAVTIEEEEEAMN